jgi:GAF domain-containing protein
MDVTFNPVLARDLAALGRFTEGTSIESVLRGVTEAVARGVPGCAGAAAVLRREGRTLTAASHSELVALLERERELREGPSHEAARTGGPVVLTDLLDEERWPGYTATAVRFGLRSIAALPIRIDDAVLVLGLYGVLPAAFDSRVPGPLVATLTEQVTVALSNVRDYDGVLTGQAQMQEALAGRALIDQAKGILMQAGGCTAEEAFQELRRISQRHQVKVVDLARQLVGEHQAKHGGRPPV